jgi:L-fuconolactonase
LSIVDAHHHLWDPAVGQYPWMTGGHAVLRRRYDLDDLSPHLLDNDVSATIVVQVRADLDETVSLLESSTRASPIAGVVGWADLTSPDVAGQIEALRAGPGGENLVGLRHAAADEPDPHWLLREDVGAAMVVLADRDLAFDLEISPRELASADTLARSHPKVRFVVDHGAKPPIAAGWDPHWANGIGTLAENPNVWCKLSGLVTESSWTTWTAADLKPYVQHLVRTFGASRLMFGSDWPVCELAASYRQVVGAARDAVGPLSPEEFRDVFSRNALRFYRPSSRFREEDRHV